MIAKQNRLKPTTSQEKGALKTPIAQETSFL